MIRTWNLLATDDVGGDAEFLTDLVTGRGWRIEWIVSRGQATPRGQWFDQDEDEWVLVVAGSAGLLIEGESTERVLTAGNAVWLPAHVRHRVTWTDPAVPTVWCAVFVSSDPVDPDEPGP